MQSLGKTISFWGKNKVRNNFHIKEKLDFVLRKKTERWWLKVAFAFARFLLLWTSFRWSWRSKPLARLKTRISSHPTSTAYLLRRGVDFASTQRIDISCFCWQSFPLVFTHHLLMKVPVVILYLFVLLFSDRQTAAPCNESVAVSRPVQLLSLRLKHATCRTDTTPGKKTQKQYEELSCNKKSWISCASSTSNTLFDNNAWGFCKKSLSSCGDFAR